MTASGHLVGDGVIRIPAATVVEVRLLTETITAANELPRAQALDWTLHRE